MADKLYMCKTRCFDLAKYHLDLFEERVKKGLIEKCAQVPEGIAAPREWILNYDCKDLSIQCTLMCALAVEAEGVLLLQMSDERLLPDLAEREAFQKKYLRQLGDELRTRPWRRIRKALEHRLSQLGCKLPDFGKDSSGKDELDQLMDSRNVHAHLKGTPAGGDREIWLFDPFVRAMGAEVGWDSVAIEYVRTARRHWEITESVYEVYSQFWRIIRE